MNEIEGMPYYEDGEQRCPLCNVPLPAHNTWPGARYRYCMKSECKHQLLAGNRQGWQYIEADTRGCDAEGCTSFLPEGRYSSADFKTCSADCFYACVNAGMPTRMCACGCGQEVRRITWINCGDGPVYFSRQHMGKHRIEKHLSASAGVFRPILDDYFSGFAKTHYRNLVQARSKLAPFLHFLNAQGILSLEAVTPKIITKYIAWWNSADHGVVEVSHIKTFFQWAIEMNYREQANPVISSFHSPRREKGEPRPYSDQELESIWTLLVERGSARDRFAIAIAEEAGLRIGEICRLRVQDVEVLAQRCFVRLPNKTNCERFALFGEKTKQCFEAWMKQRDPECGHDLLLHNVRGNMPCSEHRLRASLNLTLCKTYLGKQVNETGLDRFSIHRLRHTMATNLIRGGADMITVMASGGWGSYDAACGYAAVDRHVSQRGYENAMRRVQVKKKAPRTTRTLTPAELVTRESNRLVEMYLEEARNEKTVGSAKPEVGA